MRKITGYFLIIISILIVIFVLYRNSLAGQRVNSFSNYTLLNSTWEKYKNSYINSDGRVIDKSQNNITTSEGQSYAMLRSVWIDDRDTFDRVWKWTKDVLKRPSDNLFGWRWGQNSSGKYGFDPNGGINSATDADTDIALALLFASNRWSDKSYLEDSKKIITDIWNTETATTSGARYITAGNWAQDGKRIILNPSYFAPYAYRVFSKVDSKHDWISLANSSYEVLQTSASDPLDKNSSSGLPPDWVALDRFTGRLSQTSLTSQTTDYSFDAMRIPFRIGLDYAFYKSSDSQKFLDKICPVLISNYKKNNQLDGRYSHDGSVIDNVQSPAFYGGSIACFVYKNPTLAKQIYQNKILKLYSNSSNSFINDLSYYDQNWLWFGAAYYNHALSNF